MTRHLVTGCSGQDGRLLVARLAAAGHEVVACSHSGEVHVRAANVVPVQLDVRDTDRFAALVATYQPEAVHNLAAMSSVSRTWDAPTEADGVNHRAVVSMLEVLADSRPTCHFLQASSSEIFGPVTSGLADEQTPLAPVSPYGETKAAAHRAVINARDVLRTTNLILFGHTGPGHGASFVIPTICRAAAEVAVGARKQIELRDPSIARDWGSARDFVRAFALACGAVPGDYVIATGELHRLGDVAQWALDAAGGAAGPSSVATRGNDRPKDFGGVRGNARRACEVLGWRPEVTLREEVAAMVVEALRSARNAGDDAR